MFTKLWVNDINTKYSRRPIHLWIWEKRVQMFWSPWHAKQALLTAQQTRNVQEMIPKGSEGSNL